MRELPPRTNACTARIIPVTLYKARIDALKNGGHPGNKSQELDFALFPFSKKKEITTHASCS
jgi:hypothetical protein